MKQTAVQFLYKFVQLKLTDEQQAQFEGLFQQALEMEKEQLIMFGAQCMVESEKESGLGAIKIYELYFNKTFNKETK